MQPRVWILGHPANATNIALATRWRDCGVNAWLIPPGDAQIEARAGDVAITRIDVLRSLDGVEPGLLDVLDLSERGIHVLNPPDAVLAAHDKLRTALALEATGLPHPRTAFLRPGQSVPLPPPLVLKPRFGSWGADVFRCFTEDEVELTVQHISRQPWFRRSGAVVQSYVPNESHDLRVLVAGGRVVGAKRRVAPPGEWRTNVALGAAELPGDPTDEAAALAVAAVAALGGDLFGVDLLPVTNGHVVLEVNGAVEFDDLYTLDGGDVYADAAAALDLLPLDAQVPIAV